jgi:hypothetical protein
MLRGTLTGLCASVALLCRLDALLCRLDTLLYRLDALLYRLDALQRGSVVLLFSFFFQNVPDFT